MSLILMIELVEKQTFNLLDYTLKKNATIKMEDFNDIVEKFINLFKIVNNTIVTQDNDENSRANQIIKMNDDVFKYADNLRTKVKNNKEKYIIEEVIKEKEGNEIIRSQSINKSEKVMGNNEEDIILRDETQNTIDNELNANAIKFLINENSTVESLSSFNNLVITNENYFKILMLDMTKDKTTYKTNYVFKSFEPDILYQIYEHLKTDEPMKKSIIIEIEVEPNAKIFYLMFIAKKEFRIRKYMRYYITQELDLYAIDTRFEIMEKRGKILMKDTIEKSK